MPADLPALTRLTEDVVAAMHAAEQAQRRRRRWRREFPLAVVLLALLVPAALVLRAALAGGHDPHPAPPVRDHAARVVARACGAGAGTVAAGLAVRAVARRGTDGGLRRSPPAAGACA
jgi:hypothetical protein